MPAVAGLGGAGIAAANEALDQSLTVIGIDKTSGGGGATAKSGGVYYAGGGTPIQIAAGVEDSPENMFNYLIQETGSIVKESTLKNFCDTSAENTQWLMEEASTLERDGRSNQKRSRLAVQTEQIFPAISSIR